MKKTIIALLTTLSVATYAQSENHHFFENHSAQLENEFFTLSNSSRSNSQNINKKTTTQDFKNAFFDLQNNEPDFIQALTNEEKKKLGIDYSSWNKYIPDEFPLDADSIEINNEVGAQLNETNSNKSKNTNTPKEKQSKSLRNTQNLNQNISPTVNAKSSTQVKLSEMSKNEKMQSQTKVISQNAHTNRKTCWDEAGKFHKVDPWLLYSIAIVENASLNPKAIGKNKNGTFDLGLMQINDKVWLPVLKKKGITKEMLKNPCVSIYTGAWILRQQINEFGSDPKNLPKAIGSYHSRTPKLRDAYYLKVKKVYTRITKDRLKK